MYVCICNRHAERDIRKAAASGLRCPREIYAFLGKPPRCGRCLSLATEVIDSVHKSTAFGDNALAEGS